MAKTREENTTSHKVLTVVGIVLCVILIPILIINVTLIIKSYTNPDDVPSIGGWSPFIVLTPSMEPNINSGDLIFSKAIDPSDVKINDVISFFDPDSRDGTAVLTHRVKDIITEADGTLSFKTKGDANDAEDRLAVSEDKLVGIYRFRIPGMGNVAMFMQTTAGLIVCVVIPLILLVGWDIFRRRRYESKNQQDTDALLAELAALKARQAAEQAEGNADAAPAEAPAPATTETVPTADAEPKDENPTDSQ